MAEALSAMPQHRVPGWSCALLFGVKAADREAAGTQRALLCFALLLLDLSSLGHESSISAPSPSRGRCSDAAMLRAQP